MKTLALIAVLIGSFSMGIVMYNVSMGWHPGLQLVTVIVAVIITLVPPLLVISRSEEKGRTADRRDK